MKSNVWIAQCENIKNSNLLVVHTITYWLKDDSLPKFLGNFMESHTFVEPNIEKLWKTQNSDWGERYLRWPIFWYTIFSLAILDVSCYQKWHKRLSWIYPWRLTLASKTDPHGFESIFNLNMLLAIMDVSHYQKS